MLLRRCSLGSGHITVQCDAIRSEQFENVHFFWAYNFWITSSEQKITFARHDYTTFYLNILLINIYPGYYPEKEDQASPWLAGGRRQFLGGRRRLKTTFSQTGDRENMEIIYNIINWKTKFMNEKKYNL